MGWDEDFADGEGHFGLLTKREDLDINMGRIGVGLVVRLRCWLLL